MKETILIIVAIIIIVVFILIHLNEIKYVEAYNSGRRYIVRSQPNPIESANMLDNIYLKIFKLMNYINEKIMNTNYTNNLSKNIHNLNNKFNKIVFREDTKNNNFTSYTVNKGEEIVFCLRDKKTEKIHDINEIMYVAIHEIGHVVCPDLGHTDLFWDINKLLLENAVEIGIYKYINYYYNPKQYCGMEINATLL